MNERQRYALRMIGGEHLVEAVMAAGADSAAARSASYKLSAQPSPSCPYCREHGVSDSGHCTGCGALRR